MARSFTKYPSKQDKPVTDWRQLNKGDKLKYITDDFDGYTEAECTVADVYDDHAIAHEDVHNGTYFMKLWIDDDTQDQFYYA